ncbi:hypothetical protein LguiA_024746 [Lonicera macranthoides]
MAEVLGKITVFSTCNSSSSIHHHNHRNRVSGFSSKSAGFSRANGFRSLKLRGPSSSATDFCGRRVVEGGIHVKGYKSQPTALNIMMGMGLAIGKAQKWWEKGLKPNMREVEGAQDLVESLTNAGDKLVVVDFFSPGCGGCKALHPKICQLAEMNPDVQFLQVNYEKHKSMCYSLNVHVLPFFRFYRGAHGRVCSFSCTNATIKKFKDALAKHSPDRCSIEPVKGLEEKELLALAANKELNFTYEPKTEQPAPIPAHEEIQKAPEPALASHLHTHLPLPLSLPPKDSKDNKTLVSSGR